VRGWRTITAGQRIIWRSAAMLVVLLAWVPSASAQSPEGRDVYEPLTARMSPGVVARWSAQAGRAGVAGQIYHQPVEVRLTDTGPSGGGRVTWFGGIGDRRGVTAAAPFAAGLLVGATYRVAISDMPEFPGVTLYPTLEVLDRLHPPLGQKFAFPIPVEVTAEDVRLALQGHLVTRVVFLEEPRLSAGNEQTRPMMVRDVDPRKNALAEADRAGRPMVILRLGSRTPPTQNAPAAFFGTGAPLEFPMARPVSHLRHRRGLQSLARPEAVSRVDGTVRIRSRRPGSAIRVAGAAR